jgi:hypothetical protein
VLLYEADLELRCQHQLLFECNKFSLRKERKEERKKERNNERKKETMRRRIKERDKMKEIKKLSVL